MPGKDPTIISANNPPNMQRTGSNGVVLTQMFNPYIRKTPVVVGGVSLSISNILIPKTY